MNKKIWGLILAILLITLLNTGWLAYQYVESNRFIVIDIIKVFNEFNLKKDMEQRVEHRMLEYTNEIDSLKGIYTGMRNNHAAPETLAVLAVDIDTLEHRAQRAYELSNSKINEQVWVRLNTLLTEYGDAYKYRIVIGANGMGTVLYNRKAIDKTDELIRFINKKYESGH